MKRIFTAAFVACFAVASFAQQTTKQAEESAWAKAQKDKAADQRKVEEQRQYEKGRDKALDNLVKKVDEDEKKKKK